MTTGPLGAVLAPADLIFDAAHPAGLVGANVAFRRGVFERIGMFSADVQRVRDGVGSTEDHELLGRLYDADVTVVEGAGLDRRWVEYRDHHLAPELREFEDFWYRPFEIEAHVLGPNAAYAMFRYALRATTPERPVDIVGRGTFVLRRTAGGAWRVAHSQTSGRARRDADPAFPR